MKDCLECGKPLSHVEGRKEKSFCDVNCRNKYFYKKNKDLIKKGKEVLLKNLTEPTNEIKPEIKKPLKNQSVNNLSDIEKEFEEARKLLNKNK